MTRPYAPIKRCNEFGPSQPTALRFTLCWNAIDFILHLSEECNTPTHAHDSLIFFPTGHLSKSGPDRHLHRTINRRVSMWMDDLCGVILFFFCPSHSVVVLVFFSFSLRRDVICVDKFFSASNVKTCVFSGATETRGRTPQVNTFNIVDQSLGSQVNLVACDGAERAAIEPVRKSPPRGNRRPSDFYPDRRITVTTVVSRCDRFHKSRLATRSHAWPVQIFTIVKRLLTLVNYCRAETRDQVFCVCSSSYGATLSAPVTLNC